MPEQLTPNASSVVTLAHQQAGKEPHGLQGRLEPVHLLLGLIQHGRGVGAQALDDLGSGIDELRRDIEATLPAESVSQWPTMATLAPGPEPAVRLAGREARHRRDAFIGTEHLLLALLNLNDVDDAAAAALARQGITHTRAQQQIARIREQQDELHSIAAAPGKLLVDVADQLQELISDHERLGAEVIRLRNLLRTHGIDPSSSTSSAETA